MQETLKARDELLRHLTWDCAASWRDLTDLGLSDYTTRKWVHSESARDMAAAEAVRVPPVGLAATVALVPVSDELGRR